MDEPALLKAAKTLDQETLSLIFDAYAPAIYRYSFRFCHDSIESDQIVGEVFTQFLERLAAGEGPLTNLRSHIYQIAYCLLVDREPSADSMVRLTSEAGTRDKLEFENRLLLEQLVSALNKDLTAIQQHVLILRFLEDFSLGETAIIVGKSVSNVKVIQHRGITKLRRLLGFQAENHRQKLTSRFDTGLNKVKDL
jgi:RNA polymerase sigma-70 factor (ECF subfamily)